MSKRDGELSSLEETIMAALADEKGKAKSLYGLEVVKAIEIASKGKRKLSTGSLYPTLRNLEQKGWVSSAWGDESPEEKMEREGNITH